MAKFDIFSLDFNDIEKSTITLNSIKINNYKGIDVLHIPLCSDTIIFYGSNGSGKTSVTTAIALALSSLVIGNAEDIRTIKESDFRKSYRITDKDIMCDISSEIELTLDILFDYLESVMGANNPEIANMRMHLDMEKLDYGVLCD